MNILKITALVLVILVVLNLILFAMGRISVLFFWIIIIAAALMAFYIIPNVRKQRLLEK